MNSDERKQTIWRIVTYSFLVLALAFIGPLLGGTPSSLGLGFVIWGTAPTLVAVLLRLVTRDWSDAGLWPAIRKNGFWYIVSILAYPAIMAVTLLIGAMISVSSVSVFSITSYLQTALAAFPIFFIFAVFEEFGWRGYLVPKLALLRMNNYLMHAIVAVVWATWHLPFIRELTWLYTSEDLVTFVPHFFLGAIAFSLLYNELRLVTGTFWPAVLMHAISNSFGHPMAADYVTFSTGKAYLGSISSDEFFVMAFFTISGIALYRWRIKKEALVQSLT